jgi:glycosyltransferase involved in cell wall biosynthesis
MKIGIYNEPSDSGIGGGEYSVAVLAEALGKKHEVEIIHHRSTLTPEQLAELFDVDLTSVRLRYVEYQLENQSNGNPWALYQAAKGWHSNLSKPYDLFINFGHKAPPFCHSRSGILMVLFPIFDRSTAWPWNLREWDNSSVLRKCLRFLYHEWEWRRRLKSYRVKLANSHFTKYWAQFRWGVECQVLYPPVDDHQFGSTAKSNMVLSVGRFVASGQKQQREMVNAFLRIVEDGQQGWEFFSVGGLSNSPADRAYFDNVRRRGEGREVHVKANIERSELRSLYEQAKIFWHASGYRMKEKLHPEMQEHFGISTVEAMAAGCVPVVVKRGGQPEIVEHGVSGFLWDTLGELRDYTVQLMRDDGLRARMSREARVRSQLFGRKMFVEQFQNILKEFL